MPSYYKWATDKDITLKLDLREPDQSGSTGKSPEVSIRRHRSIAGVALDNYWWNGTTFQNTASWITMSEFDATNNPGLYLYFFEQSNVGVEQIYLVRYRHTSSPTGFDDEVHIFTDELFIPSTSPAVPVVPGDTVMGRLADMEDSTGNVALANADAVWDEQLSAHLLPGSTGEALNACAGSQVGARQIDITVEDQASQPIQGATVDVFDNTNTFHIFRTYTDNAGQVSIAIDDGTYNIRLFASGYSFTVPEVLVVTADGSVTYSGTALISIIPPASPDLCAIYGVVDDVGGNPVDGACVEAYAVTPQTVGEYLKSDLIASTRTATDGTFQIDLVRLTQVQFKITDPDTKTDIYDEIKTVPDAASQALESWT